jgi:hypothetical protein
MVVGSVLIPVARPSSLSSPPVLESIEVTYREFDDAHAVQVALTLGSETSLVVPVGGIMTAFDCAPGSVVDSGSAPLRIDGQPLVAIGTKTPVWRDLPVDAAGEDARDLNDELARLGYTVPPGNAVTETTLAAVTSLFKDAGVAPPADKTIPAARVVWIPSESAHVAACQAAVGQRVEAGQPIASLQRTLIAAQVGLPEGSLEGDRVVQVEGETIPIDAQGGVAPEGLTAIAATDAYRLALLTSPDAPSLGARIVLTTPVNVAVVPRAPFLPLMVRRGASKRQGARRFRSPWWPQSWGNPS